MAIEAVLWIAIVVTGIALFVIWADRKNKRHPGNVLRGSGSAIGNTKHSDPLDRTDTN